MKRPGKKHTNILLPKQSNVSSSPKELFYKSRGAGTPVDVYSCTGTAVGLRYTTTPRYSTFSPPPSFSKKGFYLRALGVSAGLWLCLNFSLRNGEAKQTEPSAFRSKTEPQNRSLAGGSRHTVPALTSPKTNTLKTRPPQPGNQKKKGADFNSNNQPPLSHLRSLRQFSPENWAHSNLFTRPSLV